MNNVSFRQKLDPIAKNILRRQNPSEFVIKDISTFDAQNPIIGSFLKEVDLGKKDTTGSLIKKAPNIKDIEIKSPLEAFKNRNDNDENSNFPPLTFSPPTPPPPPLSPPLRPPSFFQLPPPPPPTFFQTPSQPPSTFQFSQSNRQQPTNFL